MAKRELDPRLQKLYKEGKKVYSISKANTIDQCLYQAYLTYIQKQKGRQSVYGIAGTKVHDTLEAIMKGEADESALLPAIDSEIEAMELFGVSFPKDRQGGDSIRDNWLLDMRHFARHFVKPKGIFKEETFVLFPLQEERYVQGYIDLIRLVDREKRIVEVYDWKTSSQFSDKDLLHHGRQLVFYTLALEHMGYTVRKAAWIMLKYVSVTFMGRARKSNKKKAKLQKVIERRRITKDLERFLREDLEELGYDEFTVEEMMDIALETNEIPSVLTDRYKIIPYVRVYPITDELKQETIDYLNRAADKFEAADPGNKKAWPSLVIDKNNEFFCSVLCNHGPACHFLQDYLSRKDAQKELEDLF